MKHKLFFTLTLSSVLVCSLMFLMGCKEDLRFKAEQDEIVGEDAENEAIVDESTIILYYINSEKTKLVEEEIVYDRDRYGSITNISNVLELLSTDLADSNLLPSIPDTVEMNKVDFNKDNKSVIIDYNSNFNELDSNEALLLRASVVLSLIQFEYVNAAKITVDGQPLLDSNGQPIGYLDQNDIIITGDDYLLNSETHSINLYFTNKNRTALVLETREVQLELGQTLPQVILEELIKGPTDPELQATIPQESIVNEVFTSDGICYIDFNKNFVQGQLTSRVSDELIIFSIVNSLTDLATVNQVQFLVDGVMIPKYNSIENFDKVFSRNLDIIEK
ncbi:GerMN domain-containing protein [Vallitalea okinawensis]|uniref:GerMN domain-containing protein n=1 Tax=Vallitalea okinawensis TaxID=2078660 RepID=UPI0013008AB2|nr:GerMN domain-containing protein [Vallitalea okinawensis]